MSPAACTLVMICAATLPFVLELLARERALRGKDELASRWFAYARRHQLIATGTVLGWITLMIQLIDQPSPLRAMLSRGHPFGVMAAMVLILAPAAIIPATLGLIAHGVARRLDTTGFTWREMLTRAAWMAVLGVVPAALIGLGTLLLGRMPLAGVALYLLSAVVAIACLKRAQKGFVFSPHAVTHGELRDRIFALAARANVRLQQVYVLPMKRARMANAFAVQGQVVMLTDLLLERLSREEVDAVLAHEIAHLKRGDPLKIALAWFGFTLVPFLSLLSLGFGWALLAFWIGLLPACAISRRIERATDREALKLGVSGAVLIRGLVRLATLSHVPIRWKPWSGWLLTHPSIERRAHWIAAASGIDAPTVATLLAGAEESGEHYETPPHLEAGGRLFSTTFKRQVLTRNGFQMVAISLLVPAAVFAEAHLMDLAGHAALVAIALILTPIGSLALANFLSVQPLRRLRAPLARRLGLGDRPESAGWSMAGFAPHGQPRVYEGFANWELGFVRLGGEGLLFAGEEARFTLRPEQIVDVAVVRSIPSWIPSQALRVRWCDAAGVSREFRLTLLDVATFHGIGAKVRRLAREIESWRAAAPALAAGPHAGPPTAEVTCTHPRMLARPSSLVTLLVLDILMGAMVSLLFGLPFFGFHAPGWLDLVFVALASQTFLMIPMWRYRDPVDVPEAQSRQRAVA